MTGRLAGKVAVITGTAGGQGREAALRFAAEGAFVVGCDLDERAGCETAEAVARAGGRMTTARVDLGDPDAARVWIEAAAREHGRIDILYNNASAARFAPVGEMSVEDWRFTMRNELDLVFHAVKYAWPHLARPGGVIVNIASTVGHRASRSVGALAHAASKGAVIAMTRQIALEGAAHGLRAVSISPGFILTTGSEAALSRRPGALEAASASIPLGRPGRPADVVGVALSVVLDEASYVTGIDIVVDGGMTV